MHLECSTTCTLQSALTHQMRCATHVNIADGWQAGLQGRSGMMLASHPARQASNMLLWLQEKNNATELLDGQQPSMAELAMWPRESLK